MKYLDRSLIFITCLLAASLAQAGVQATAVMEFQSFVAKGSDGLVLDFLNDFDSLSWTGSADEDVVFDGVQDKLQDANTTTGVNFPPICVGDDCPQISNDVFPVFSGTPVANYSTADQRETDAPITNLGSFDSPAVIGNAAYCGIATGEHTGSANSNNGLESSFVLAADQPDGITLEATVRVYLEAFVSAGELAPGKAAAGHSDVITITDLTTGVVVFRVEPPVLNQAVAVNANDIGFDLQLTGTHTAGVVHVIPFTATTGPLTAGIPYQLSARNNTNADCARIEPEEEVLGCRLTGGGVSSSTLDNGEIIYLWDGTMEKAEDTEEENRYQFGGQAGANTALPPQPSGEWQHHQQRGPFGSFSFHAGTHSAPAGTEVIEIRCSDPGGCAPSGNPPSPNKQLDFDCIGTFSNIAGGGRAPNWLIADANATDEGRGNRSFDGTFHYCQVNVDDLGEGPDPAEPNSADCPAEGFGEKGDDTVPANCDCPDFYRITIYDGVNAADVVWLDEDNIDPTSLNTTDIIYEVDGYLGRGGNGLQLHKLTGFDR